MYRYFKRIAGVGSGNYIYFCKSKGLSDERINSITTSNNSITPELSHYDTKTRVKFNGDCLKQDKATYSHGTIVNIYIVHKISKNYNVSSYPPLENCLLGVFSLTKHIDIDQYKYSGYGIGFDGKGEFSFGSTEICRNVIILGVDMSSSVHANKKIKNIQELDNTTTCIQSVFNKLYSINFIKTNTKLFLSLHYNGANSDVFVNGTDIHKFKAKDSEIVATPFCLENFSKDFSVDNMKENKIKWICL